jgi:hypothetical protein
MWSDGAADGGADVTSYRIYYDQGVNEWTELISGVTTTTFTQSGLAFGLTYQFKIQSKTDFGYSEESEVLSLLCAAEPSRPNQPTTSILDENVIFSWILPSS